MDHMGFQLPDGLPRPPVMTQPPQIFSGYHDDMAIPQLPPDMAAQMFPDSFLLDDPQDPKRRRIARACDMCRKKKIKCDGKLPSCTQCINYKADCAFTQVEKKRTPPKGAKYIEGLENRLARMEHLLKLSGLLDEDDNGATDLSELEKRLTERMQQQSRQGSTTATSAPTSPSLNTTGNDASTSTPLSSATSPEAGKDKEKEKDKDDEKDKDKDKEHDAKDSPDRRSSATPSVAPEKRRDEEVENLSELMCSLVTNQSGETRYIGSSSGFSIFSPKGVQWINGKTGDNSFQQMISEVSADDHKWTNWKPEVFGDVFRRPVFLPLPPKDETLSLLKDYFENFNCMFPLFHQPTFMHLVERQYSSDPYQSSGWWGSLNCALAIAHRLRVMSNLVPYEEDDKAWGYIKNALGVYTELSMRNTDLLSVQALLGIALFMQGTPNPQPSFLLIATALRVAHSIGLHRRGTGFNLNPIEIEQRKRVFWIAYLLDKDLCLRSGRPPAQDDDDMDVELPDADPPDNIGNIPLADGKGKMNLFRVMSEFAVIEGKVYRRLYATKSTKQTDGEFLLTIGELDQELEDWKDRIPIDFRPEHEIKASHTPLILHVVMLHFAYNNCLTTIHRMSIHHGFWTNRLSNYALQGLNTKALNPRVYSSATLCTAAARSSISLLKYIPQGDFNCVWMILYFPVSALVTLFANIVNNPLDPRAKSDTRLMNLVVTFLSMLGQEAEYGGVHRMLGICTEFERIAKAVIEKAEKDQSSRRKRKNADAAGKSSSGTTNKPANINSNTKPRAASSLSPPPSTGIAPNGRSSGPTTPSYSPHNFQTSTAQFSPPLNQAPSYSPMGASFHGDSPGSQNQHAPHSVQMTGAEWQQDFSMGQGGEFDNFAGGEMEGISGGSPSSFISAFQQPVLPQELFNLPMNLDWNWAEVSGAAYPSVENGNYGGDPNILRYHH